MSNEINKIVGRFKDRKGALISILQEIQKKYGYLSSGSISALADELKISENVIYGVATFYTQFKFTKPGKHQVKVCLGTACHVRGSKKILREIEQELKITHGETTEDELFSLEKVACMGCCALSPVLVVNDDVYGTCTPSKAKKIVIDSKEEG
jgi:NADH-quinone oxidoreductase subunit E